MYYKKGDEDLEEKYECTFKPQINKSQKAVEGRRKKPIFEPTITEEDYEKYQNSREKKEMKGWTFKPKINQKSLKLVDSVQKRKQEEERKNHKDAEMVFPLKQKIEFKSKPKASMFFDSANNKGIEKISQEKARYNSLRNSHPLNKDIYGSKNNENINTPQFEEIKECNEEPPLPRDHPIDPLDDTVEFERLVKQVIWDSNGYESPKFNEKIY